MTPEEKISSLLRGRLTRKQEADFRDALANKDEEICAAIDRYCEPSFLVSSVENTRSKPPSDDVSRLDQQLRSSGVSIDELLIAVNRDLPSRGIDEALLRAAIETDVDVDAEVAVSVSRKLNTQLSSFYSTRNMAKTTLSEQSAAANEIEELTEIQQRDLEFQLEDFLPEDDVSTMLKEWANGRETFYVWLNQKFPAAGDYQDLLVRILASLVLTNDVDLAADVEDRLVNAAGDDKARWLDSRYLRGRARWYRNEIAGAIEDLLFALDLGNEMGSSARVAQCSYYLARIKGRHGGSFPESEDRDFMLLARENARKSGRLDVELLATRANVIGLRVQKKHRESAELCRKLLSKIGSSATHLIGIKGHLMIDLGIALRNLGGPQNCDEAEAVYDELIGGQYPRATQGMARYLKADLYSDGMQVHWLRSLQSAELATKQQELEVAKAKRDQAINLCEEAKSILESTHDWPAARKAVSRLIALSGQELAEPIDSNDVIEDYSARRDYVTALLLQSLQADQDDVIQKKSIQSLDDVNLILRHVFKGIVADDSELISGREIDASLFLNERTVLAIPWQVGNMLFVRVLSNDGKAIKTVGTFVLSGYDSGTKDALMFLGTQPDDIFTSAATSLAQSLQSRVTSDDPILLRERRELRTVDTVVVLAPTGNEDWACPLEWFQATNDKGSEALSLIDFCKHALVHVTRPCNPIEAAQITINSRDCEILATDQHIEGELIFDRTCTALNRSVKKLQLEGGAFGATSEMTIVVGHDSDEHELAKLLSDSDLSQSKAVILLFCSSSNYQQSHGPYAKSVVRDLLGKMDKNGVVVGARIPVTFAEAMRFADYLLSEENDGQSLAKVVVSYLRNAKRFGGNGLVNPWVVIA